MNIAKRSTEAQKRWNKQEQENYLTKIMEEFCPNITAISGALIGAKLIGYAGSLKRLALLPASTVQLLGAEKAFFRFLKDKGSRPPKYGVLFQHGLVAKVKKPERAKLVRMIADKVSIAAKVDYFKGKFVGDKLRKEIEEKFKP